VFHFNKKHLEDQTIPMWVLKFHGETLYVNHVDCTVPWSTKETPDNSHTKGSIKVKDVLLRINDANEAQISQLTLVDKFRLRNQKLGITRIMFRPTTGIHKALMANEYKHSPFKNIRGACSSSFIICDLLNRADVTMAGLKYTNQFRIVQPNEGYYTEYDNSKGDNIPVDYGHPSTPFEYS
jgi:hypothetical protein